MAAKAVYLRLGAALLAVAAGAAGVVVVIGILRSLPPPAGPVSGSSAPVTPVQTGTIAGGRIPTPTEPGFPSPPFGAIVLGQEAGSRALGLAVLPGKSRSLVRVSVLSGAGPGARGLDVSVRFGSGAVSALSACGTGCYQARVRSSTARRVTVTLGTKMYPFELPPGRSPRDATAIVNRAGRVWHGLKTLVWHERLASNPTDALFTLYRTVAPDELSYSITGNSQAIIIGGSRWDRTLPNGHWVRSRQDPPIREPTPFWNSVTDARVAGSARVGGRPVWDVVFFDPQTPGWFEAWIDKASGRTLELRMTAVAHFMHHIYGPFNAPFRLHAPAKT